eukprot:330159-Rhodomonas_salina.2
MSSVLKSSRPGNSLGAKRIFVPSRTPRDAGDTCIILAFVLARVDWEPDPRFAAEGLQQLDTAVVLTPKSIWREPVLVGKVRSLILELGRELSSVPPKSLWKLGSE